MQLLWTLTWKATCLLVFGFGASFLLRKTSAASRAALWQALAIAMVVMAVLSYALPQTMVRSTIVPNVFHFEFEATALPAAATLPIPFLPVLWLSGLAMVLFRLLAGHSLMAWITRRAPERISAPVTWGILRPRVLLPLCAEDWSEEKRRTVLLHEDEHVRRRDPMWQFAWQAICAALWFHPLAWMAYERFRQEAEQACDDAVLAAGVAAPDYAELLIDFASVAPVSPVVLGMQGQTDLAARLRAVLHSGRQRGGANAAAVVLACSLLLSTLPLAALTDETPKPAPKQEDTKLSDPGVTPPRPVKRDQPKYTPDAKEQKIEGSVRLLIRIDEEGKVAVKTVEKPLYPSLDASAIETVQTWEFQPARKDGKPVSVLAHVEINFRLL